MERETESSTDSEGRIGRSVSLDHAAALLGVSRRTIYNRIRESRLETIRTTGGSQRVLLKSLGILSSRGVDDDHATSAQPSGPERRAS